MSFAQGKPVETLNVIDMEALTRKLDHFYPDWRIGSTTTNTVCIPAVLKPSSDTFIQTCSNQAAIYRLANHKYTKKDHAHGVTGYRGEANILGRLQALKIGGFVFGNFTLKSMEDQIKNQECLSSDLRKRLNDFLEQPKVESEIDFLFIHPTLGIIIGEVKGWHQGRDAAIKIAKEQIRIRYTAIRQLYQAVTKQTCMIPISGMIFLPLLSNESSDDIEHIQIDCDNSDQSGGDVHIGCCNTFVNCEIVGQKNLDLKVFEAFWAVKLQKVHTETTRNFFADKTFQEFFAVLVGHRSEKFWSISDNVLKLYDMLLSQEYLRPLKKLSGKPTKREKQEYKRKYEKNKGLIDSINKNICKWGNMKDSVKNFYSEKSSTMFSSEQLAALECKDPYQLIYGSPGTGKTLVIMAKAKMASKVSGHGKVVCVTNSKQLISKYKAFFDEKGVVKKKREVFIQSDFENIDEVDDLFCDEANLNTELETVIKKRNGSRLTIIGVTGNIFASEVQDIIDEIEQTSYLRDFTKIPLRMVIRGTTEIIDYWKKFAKNHRDQYIIGHTVPGPVVSRPQQDVKNYHEMICQIMQWLAEWQIPTNGEQVKEAISPNQQRWVTPKYVAIITLDDHDANEIKFSLERCGIKVGSPSEQLAAVGGSVIAVTSARNVMSWEWPFVIVAIFRSHPLDSRKFIAASRAIIKLFIVEVKNSQEVEHLTWGQDQCAQFAQEQSAPAAQGPYIQAADDHSAQVPQCARKEVPLASGYETQNCTFYGSRKDDGKCRHIPIQTTVHYTSSPSASNAPSPESDGKIQTKENEYEVFFQQHKASFQETQNFPWSVDSFICIPDSIDKHFKEHNKTKKAVHDVFRLLKKEAMKSKGILLANVLLIYIRQAVEVYSNSTTNKAQWNKLKKFWDSKENASLKISSAHFLYFNAIHGLFMFHVSESKRFKTHDLFKKNVNDIIERKIRTIKLLEKIYSTIFGDNEKFLIPINCIICLPYVEFPDQKSFIEKEGIKFHLIQKPLFENATFFGEFWQSLVQKYAAGSNVNYFNDHYLQYFIAVLNIRSLNGGVRNTKPATYVNETDGLLQNFDHGAIKKNQEKKNAKKGKKRKSAEAINENQVVPRNKFQIILNLNEKQCEIEQSTAMRKLIYGPPGTGKSVIVKRLALEVAKSSADKRRIIVLTHTQTLKKEYELFFEERMGYRCPLLEVKTWLDPGDIQQEDHLFCDEGPPDDGILEYILTNRQALAITVASMTCHSNAGIITDDESPLIAPYKTYQKWELLRTMRNSWFISDEWSSLWETQTKVCMPIKAHDITGAAVIKKSFEEADELCRDIINIFRHYGITSSPETNVVDNAQIKLNIVASRTAIIVVHEDDTKFVRDFLEKENIPNGSAIDQMVDGNCIAVEYWRETFSLEWTIVIFVNFHAARSDSIINESIVAMSRARSRLIVLECKKPYPLQ